MALQEEMILRVDFNAIDDRGRLSALLRYAMGSHRPKVGDWVWLMDGDGNGCLGRVVEVQGELIEVGPDWSTWNPPVRLDKQHPASFSEWSLQHPTEPEPAVKLGGYDHPYIQV